MTVLLLCHRFVWKGCMRGSRLLNLSQKLVALGNKSFFFFFFLRFPRNKPKYFVLTEWSLTSIHEQGTAAAATLQSCHQVGFSPPAEVCALQCVLSTKTAPSSLSVKRQKCCAATLPAAVWLSVAEHLRVPCWLTEPRTTQPQDRLSLPLATLRRCKSSRRDWASWTWTLAGRQMEEKKTNALHTFTLLCVLQRTELPVPNV